MQTRSLLQQKSSAWFLVLALGITCRVALVQAYAVPTVEPSLQAKIDKTVEDTLGRTKVPSASIAVVRDQQLIYANAYGAATLEPRQPAISSMRYPVGSISKEFTAAALLLLEAKGRLSINDPAGKFLEHLGPASGVTIRQLLSHTAGVRDFWPQDYIIPGMREPATPASIIERWGAKPLDFPAGTAWQYSNTGYVMAGAIAEKVGGDLFEQLETQIFRPLGMTSAFNVDAKPLPPGSPTGYLSYALGPLRPSPGSAPGWLFAAGELAMTASDLARWDIALMQGKILSAASSKELTSEVLLTNGAGTRYALGMDVTLKHGRRELGHGGEINGFTSHHLLYPDDGIAVVVLTNQEAVDASDILADRLADLLFAQKTASGATATDQDRALFVSLQHGTLDAAKLTTNAKAYFSAQALADFHDSLGPLGDPSQFELQRSGLRGGFVTRIYHATCAGRSLEIVVRATESGLIEQLTVSAE